MTKANPYKKSRLLEEILGEFEGISDIQFRINSHIHVSFLYEGKRLCLTASCNPIKHELKNFRRDVRKKLSGVYK